MTLPGPDLQRFRLVLHCLQPGMLPPWLAVVQNSLSPFQQLWATPRVPCGSGFISPEVSMNLRHRPESPPVRSLPRKPFGVLASPRLLRFFLCLPAKKQKLNKQIAPSLLNFYQPSRPSAVFKEASLCTEISPINLNFTDVLVREPMALYLELSSSCHLAGSVLCHLPSWIQSSWRTCFFPSLQWQPCSVPQV